MSPEQFNQQPVGKGDKIRIQQRASGNTYIAEVTGVSWDDYLYHTDDAYIPCENVIEYMPKIDTP